MKTLRRYIVENARTPASMRGSIMENSGQVQTIESLGLKAATVAFPAAVSLDERAARMNSFWKKLVDFQYEDVVVVALCSRKGS